MFFCPSFFSSYVSLLVCVCVSGFIPSRLLIQVSSWQTSCFFLINILVVLILIHKMLPRKVMVFPHSCYGIVFKSKHCVLWCSFLSALMISWKSKNLFIQADYLIIIHQTPKVTLVVFARLNAFIFISYFRVKTNTNWYVYPRRTLWYVYTVNGYVRDLSCYDWRGMGYPTR